MMNANDGFSSNIIILDRRNRERWSTLMKSLFGAQDVDEIVQDCYNQLGADPQDAQRINKEGLQEFVLHSIEC